MKRMHKSAEPLECGEPSPLCFSFPGTKSGEGSPHSMRFAISITIIADWRHKIR
jgi:hypothetical protein